MAERQFGPYRLVRQVAVGGMAEIHLAKTNGIAGFEKYVALKMIHPNFAEDDAFIQMLVDEAKIAVQLAHGNIAQTFDLGRVGDTYYITMEYVDGADLYKVLRRSSERDLELPLDVCAFIAKEVTSGLDHAHRKRDHTGRPLGIVHRDVSPQNVLLSYSGEVKLVDFGIAKATMKARQTAVGVIKGKYYYMSPEQARGESIDHRSDIFSAGIVLYEMITGQMLYLEEDLQRLLEMARRADIAPPSRLRKGIPPQLERIVMHALARNASDRYQSAGDFATDLERFLHAYSPVFTASKVAALLRDVIGEPGVIARDEHSMPSIEVRGGPMATNVLDQSQLLVERDELRDENSVIFRVDELKPPVPKASPRPAKPQIPSIAPKPAPRGPRKAHEDTRQLEAQPAAKPRAAWDHVDTESGEELEHVGERTMISAPRGGGFMMDAAEDGVEATVITGAPQAPGEDTEDTRIADVVEDPDVDEDDNPTMTRDPIARPRVSARRPVAPAPPALAAKIHAPAVSELRKPRPRRGTPPDGSGSQPNVLQQIVNAQGSAPMPTPRPLEVPAAPPPLPMAMPIPAPLPTPVPIGQAPTEPAIPPGPYTAPGQVPGVPPHLQPYVHVQGYPPAHGPQGYYGYPPQYAYAPGPQDPLSLTGQLRLAEVDEVPSQYKLESSRAWMKYALAGVTAVAVASAIALAVTSSGDPLPTVGTVRIESVPLGADIVFDGTRLPEKTPYTVTDVSLAGKHEVRLELPKHRAYVESFELPRTGNEYKVLGLLKLMTGTLEVRSTPAGAEVRINDQIRGRTPTTITDLDTSAVGRIELRLKDHQPFFQDVTWPEDGKLTIDAKLRR